MHELEGLDGWRAMEVIRDWGLNIKAECGGACSCATCHVGWTKPGTASCRRRSDDEEDLIYSTLDQKPTSRLSCQILLSDELDGLQADADAECGANSLSPANCSVSVQPAPLSARFLSRGCEIRESWRWTSIQSSSFCTCSRRWPGSAAD